MHLVNEDYVVWISPACIKHIFLLLNNLFHSSSTFIFGWKNLTAKQRWLTFSFAFFTFCLDLGSLEQQLIFNESHICFSALCLVWRKHKNSFQDTKYSLYKIQLHICKKQTIMTVACCMCLHRCETGLSFILKSRLWIFFNHGGKESYPVLKCTNYVYTLRCSKSVCSSLCIFTTLAFLLQLVSYVALNIIPDLHRKTLSQK